MDWYIFDDGKSIGTKGSEDGVILEDFGNANGARVTLEQDGNIAPFSVTMGVYGIMFHTSFASTLEEAKNQIVIAKQKIDALFEHLKTPEDTRNDKWEDDYHSIINEIASI
jgi:hypothetical protein